MIKFKLLSKHDAFDICSTVPARRWVFKGKLKDAYWCKLRVSMQAVGMTYVTAWHLKSLNKIEPFMLNVSYWMARDEWSSKPNGSLRKQNSIIDGFLASIRRTLWWAASRICYPPSICRNLRFWRFTIDPSLITIILCLQKLSMRKSNDWETAFLHGYPARIWGWAGLELR